MKFLATAAYVLAVQAACEEEGDMQCENSEDRCMSRYTVMVGDENSKDYQDALKNDADLAEDSMKYFCASLEDAEAFLATNETEDKKTTVTFFYTDMTAEWEIAMGSGAIMTRATAILALTYISFL